ncbi:MAG: 3-dehydroquinate synthase, partial [Oscillospiraceae bacterium]|nr:3-dehydroquinate synthase [Oscillospiraceae bacterium]
MRTVHVNASREYDVLIERGLIDHCGSYIRKAVKAQTIAIVAGSNVFPLYAHRVAESLKNAGFQVVSLQIPAGEEHKTLETFSMIVNFFAENQLSRKDAALALGGGVTGDLTGFAASAYRRGINYIQMPTTLLSSVDSSVGGKTAVDLPAGKNLCGAFWQPSLVLFDPDTLNTLPQQALYAGYAEIIKNGMILDEPFFHQLEALSPMDQIESIVEHCVEIKRDVVAKDEFDTGLRGLLNFGHTFG